MYSDTPIAGPYAHERTSVSRIMVLVVLALVPATLFSLWQFGWPAIFLFLITVGTCLIAEAACLRAAEKPLRPSLLDGSALLTGWLLAMSLPPWAPWWIGVLGGLIAIVVAKQVFGGIGQNLFNPAMVARVALLISFPAELTRYVAPAPLFSPQAPGFGEGLAITFGLDGPDMVTGATLLGQVRTDLGQGHPLPDILPGIYQPWSDAVGTLAGSMGETSALLLLLNLLPVALLLLCVEHRPVLLNLLFRAHLLRGRRLGVKVLLLRRRRRPAEKPTAAAPALLHLHLLLLLDVHRGHSCPHLHRGRELELLLALRRRRLLDPWAVGARGRRRRREHSASASTAAAALQRREEARAADRRRLLLLLLL